jgi:hypothetical protein
MKTYFNKTEQLLSQLLKEEEHGHFLSIAYLGR